MNQTQQSQLQYQEQAQDQNQPQNENENVNEQQNEEEEVKEEEEEEEEEDGDQDWQDQPNDAKPPNVPTRPCMISSCSGHVTKPYLCASCKTTFACCSIECYMNIIVHRDLTSHYMTCRWICMTHIQKKIHGVRDGSDFVWYYTRPCRLCAKFEGGVCCDFCQVRYCGMECLKMDRERHEAKKGECLEKVTKQLPLNTQAPSVRSSALVPCLLTHTLSFLSLYQWSLAGRVNHAWRNATLQPLAFPHEMMTALRLDSPRIGPLHRACIRGCGSTERTISQEVIHDYTYLRSFQSSIAVDPETNDMNYTGQLMRLPIALNSLKLESRLTMKSTVEAVARFNKLRHLTLKLVCGSPVLGAFGSVLQQLTGLQELSLHMTLAKREEGDELSMEEQNEGDEADRVAITAILDTISLHLASLSSLTLNSDVHSISGRITRPLSQIQRFCLREAHFHANSSDEDLKSLTPLFQYLPGVTHLVLVCNFRRGMFFDLHLPKLHLLRDSFITCINTFGPQLETLRFEWAPWFGYGNETEDDQDQPDDFGEDHLYHALKPAEVARLLTHCSHCSDLAFVNYHEVCRTPSEIEIMSKFTPFITHLEVTLESLPEDMTVTKVTRMIESLTLSRFTHLTALELIAPESEFSFETPSEEFVAKQDSLPSLTCVTLVRFETETHLPSLLRLLPPIDSLILHGANLTAERFFEYMQYRPLVFTNLTARQDGELTIPRIRTMEEDELHWFDTESDMVHVDSILAPTSLPVSLHSFYERGVEMSKQQLLVSKSHSSDDSEKDEDGDCSRGGRVGRGGGRGRGRGRGGYISERKRKSAAAISHRWMFSRVRNWTFNWCDINIPSSAVPKTESKVDANEEDEEEGNERDHDSSLIAHLPDALAYHRTSVWIYTHAADVQRNRDFESLSNRFDHFVKERKCIVSLLASNSPFES